MELCKKIICGKNCFPAQSCDFGNNCQFASNKKIMALCNGRHEMPAEVGGYIFDTIEDVTNLSAMEERAERVLGQGLKGLDLYVTGLTPALIAVLNVCRRNETAVTLFHFNRETGDYFPQVVY